jgi:hypothetical protein
MGFAIGEEHDALVLLFENRGGRIFSAMLWPHNGLLLCARNKGGICLEYIPPLTDFC